MAPAGAVVYCRLTREPIDEASVRQAVAAAECGAVAVFAGVVRNHSRGREVRYLEYEAYEPMALKQMREIAGEAAQRWGGARGDGASVRENGRGRNERPHRCRHTAPGAGVRSLPLVHRYLERAGSYLEERGLP
ncbi:MAG: hypothetical protein KatS3mg022_2347 [Armatimonadota bacterium]|nr:MAG: hypothetical protein KatS3mg022_2347 [Armatimonadota bacterium]